jgi:hypothetical protein
MAQISILNAEHFAIVNGMTGSRFRIGSQLSGLRGRGLYLVLRVHPQNNPQMTFYYNGNPNLVTHQVQPSSDQESRDDHVLFLPWDAIVGPSGHYYLIAQAWVFDEGGNPLTYSNGEMFYFFRN